MSITWPDVVAIAPECASAEPASQTAILAMVDRQLDPDTWGSYFDDGSKFLAAHYATLARSRGKGQITAEAVGSVSRSYGDMTALAGSLGATSYGLEYFRLARLTSASLGEVF